MLVGHGADELEADGQTGGSETTGDGDGGDAGEIGGAIVAKQKRASGMILFVDARGFFVDEWRGDRSCWNDKGIDGSVGHRKMKLLDELVAHFESFQINGRGNFRAHFEARSNVFAVFRGTRGKPTGLLMVVGCFRPCDLVAGVFSFLQEWDGNIFRLCAELAEGVKRSLEDVQHVA